MGRSKFLLLVSFFVFFILSYAQNGDSITFEKEYQKLFDDIYSFKDSLQQDIFFLRNNYQLQEVQKAKLNFLKAELELFDDFQADNQIVYDLEADTDNFVTPLRNVVNLIVQSRTSIGIPLLLQYLETAEPDSDSTDYAAIYLAEVYRKIGEHQKGMDVLYDILSRPSISPENRAFAYTRLAALYAGCGVHLFPNRNDSVVKYSKLCIQLSSKKNFVFYLATAQNELSFHNLKRKNFPLALDYGLKAYDNYMRIHNFLYAADAKINLAQIYRQLQKPEKAIESLQGIEQYLDIHKYKNTLMRVYFQLSVLYNETGNEKQAYEYLNIAHKLQMDIFRAKIKTNIYDMTARYDLQEKQNKIAEEEQKNKLKSRQILFLAVISVATLLLLLLLIALYRFKSRAYKALVSQNLETQQLTKKNGV